MYDTFIYLGIIILLLGIFIVITPNIVKKRKFSREKNVYYERKVSEAIKGNKSSSEKIIILDKILHKILLDLKYNGTLGEILKKEPEYIGNINKVWESHKLRNNLVHDLDYDYSEKFLHKKLAEFSKEIRILLKNI